MNAFLVTIGDEILIGQIVDTNAAWMAQQLNLQGIRIAGKMSVADTNSGIIEGIKYALNKADLVLVTGGLGATKDDITKKAIAEMLGVGMVFSQHTYNRLEYFFQKLNRTVSEMNKNSCYMPKGAQLLDNERGLAPAMWFEILVDSCSLLVDSLKAPNNLTTNNEQLSTKYLVSMPGVPYEMQHLMTDKVLPKLLSTGNFSPIVHRTILTAGEGETMIAEKLTDFEERLPKNISLAYLPALGTVRLRLTGRGDNAELIEQHVEKLKTELVSIIPNIVAGFDTDTMPDIIGKLLKERNLTAACAESCTGGFLSHLITAIPGSSAYFTGSVIAYDNSVKIKTLKVKKSTIENHGAVSEETVKEMVAGVLKTMGADIGVAVSGIAGPSGGTKEKPVGTIWLAVGNAEKTITAKLGIDRGRAKNIEYAAHSALNLLRKFLLALSNEL